MTDLAEVLPAHAQQGRAVEFRVAADEVVRAGVELLAVPVVPGLLDVVLSLDHDGPGVPVVLLARHVVAALQEEDLFSRGRQPVGERPAPRPGADDDRVVVPAGAPEFPSVTAAEDAARGVPVV